VENPEPPPMTPGELVVWLKTQLAPTSSASKKAQVVLIFLKFFNWPF